MLKNLLTLNYIGGNFYYFYFSLSSRNLMEIWIFDPNKFFRIVHILKVYNIHPNGKVDQFITWINKFRETNIHLALNTKVIFGFFLIHLSLTIPLSIYYHVQTETKNEKNKTSVFFNGWTASLTLFHVRAIALLPIHCKCLSPLENILHWQEN